MPISPTITKTQNIVVRQYKAFACERRFPDQYIDWVFKNLYLNAGGDNLYPAVYAEIESATSTITQTINFPANQNIQIPLYGHGNAKPIVNGTNILSPFDMNFRNSSGAIVEDLNSSRNQMNDDDVVTDLVYTTNGNNGVLFQTGVLPDFQQLPAITSVVWNLSNSSKVEIVQTPYTTPESPLDGNLHRFMIKPKSGIGAVFTQNEFLCTLQGTITLSNGQTLQTNVVNVYSAFSGNVDVIVGVNNNVTRADNLVSGVMLQNVQYSLDGGVNWIGFNGTVSIPDNTSVTFRSTFINNSSGRITAEILTPTNSVSQLVNRFATTTLTTTHYVTDACTITYRATSGV